VAASPSLSLRRLPVLLNRARDDSLLRNSLFLMASAAITALLGYLFWGLAAHLYSRREIGMGGAVISLCSTVALLTYLGPWAMLIEQLPAKERSSSWTRVLVRTCALASVVTGVATAIAVPILDASNDYHSFFHSLTPVVVAVVGAMTWTLVNLIGAAFIAARKAGRLLSIQSLVSGAKVVLIIPLAAVGAGALGLVAAWVVSTIIGTVIGVGWLVPRMRLGRQTRHRYGRTPGNTPLARSIAPPRGTDREPARSFTLRLIGQHLTSVGGAVTPLVLPVVVVLRVGVTANAAFYITWMIGSVFFMVTPSVSSAVFAEGVRVDADVRHLIAKALRVSFVMLIPAMALMIVGGKVILGLFGPSYASAGYGLLVILAISAIPDAISNVAVAICRITLRLGYSTLLNLGILLVTLTGSWVLMPKFGIIGAGIAWLVAQALGAIASLPMYVWVRDMAPPR
jgi:O-antigen/teichoic acid export membrane protein